MRSASLWLYLTVAWLGALAAAVVAESHAPMLAFLSSRSQSGVLSAPADGTLPERRSPTVSCKDAVNRLAHHRSEGSDPDLCGLEKIVHVEVGTLHARSWASLSGEAASKLQKRVLTAPQQLVFPALEQTSSSFSDELRSVLSSLCSTARTVEDRIMHIKVPSLDGHGMSAPTHLEPRLLSQLLKLDDEYPEHLVVVTGSPAHEPVKRAAASRAAPRAHKPKFLERYQVRRKTHPRFSRRPRCSRWASCHSCCSARSSP